MTVGNAMLSGLGVAARHFRGFRTLDLFPDIQHSLDSLNLNRVLEGIVPPLLNVNAAATISSLVTGMVKSLEPTLAAIQATVADTAAIAISRTIRDAMANTVLPRFELPDMFRQAWLMESFQIPAWPWEDVARTIAGLKWRLFPPNLAPIDGLGLDELSLLATEGLTVWGVPRTAIAEDLLHAPTSQARRAILGYRWRAILDDCADVVEQQVGGPYGAQARLVQRAISAARDGHTEAAQTLASNTLDTILQVAYSKPARLELTSHRNGRPDALDDLRIAQGLVMETVWVVYRPYHTPAQRAALAGFSRHGTTHVAGTRQLNRRNMVQATMLATALILVLSER